MTCLENFVRIESALLYHHSVNTSPLLVLDLIRSVRKSTGAVVTCQDLEEICKVEPSLYTITGSGPTQRVEAPSICNTHKERKEKFELALSKVSPEKTPSKELASFQEKENIPSAIPKSKKAAPIEVLRGRRRVGGYSMNGSSSPSLSLESIRQRVIQKQSLPKPVYNLKGALARRKFVEAQVPKIFEQLCMLRHQAGSLSLQEVAMRLETGLCSRLSRQEIIQTIELVAERLPMMCQIINSGGLKAVKFSNWSKESMFSARSALAQSTTAATVAPVN